MFPCQQYRPSTPSRGKSCDDLGATNTQVKGYFQEMFKKSSPSPPKHPDFLRLTAPAPLARRRPLPRLPATLVVPRARRRIPERPIHLLRVPIPRTVPPVRHRQRHHARHLGRRNRIETASDAPGRKEKAGSRGRQSWKQRTPATRRQAADRLIGVTEEVCPLPVTSAYRCEFRSEDGCRL